MSKEAKIIDPGVSFRTMPVAMLEEQMRVRNIEVELSEKLLNEPIVHLVTIRNPVPNLGLLAKKMKLSGVPIKARERDDNNPIVIGGGAGMNNPYPVAEIFDAIWIGDATVGAFDAIEQISQQSLSRDEQLTLLHSAGFYTPSLLSDDELPKRHIVKQPYLGVVVDTGIITPAYPDQSKDKKAIVQVQSGCGLGCSFCIDGQRAKTTLHPDLFNRIVRDIIKNNPDLRSFRISFPSLNEVLFIQYVSGLRKEMTKYPEINLAIDIGSTLPPRFTNQIARMLVDLGETTMTFAPEVAEGNYDGVDLRKQHKPWLTDEELFNAINVGMEEGMETLVLYHLTGFAGETINHIYAYAQMVGRVKERFPGLKLVVSSGIVFPVLFSKLETGFQLGFEEGEERRQLLAHYCEEIGVTYSWLLEPPKGIRSSKIPVSAAASFTQAFFHRGSSIIGKALMDYWNNLPSDSNDWVLNVTQMHELLNERGFDLKGFYEGRNIVTSDQFEIVEHQTLND